jgi:hypothetical protein
MDSAQREAIAEILEPALKPYRGRYVSYARLPEKGVDRAVVLTELTSLAERERDRWESGFALGRGLPRRAGAHHLPQPGLRPVQPGQPGAQRPVAQHHQVRGRDRGDGVGDAERDELDPPACGTVTSGGTESILLAMRTYRDHARAERGVYDPEIVIPVTAHAAFDKAGQYFGLRLVKVPVGSDMRVDPAAVRAAITDDTVAVVGSAVGFPHGVMDPIEELAAIAHERGIGFHTDACLGGFILPWAEKLGYPVAPFDFRVPGVHVDLL